VEWYCCSGRVISEMYRGEPKTKAPPRHMHCKLNFFFTGVLQKFLTEFE